MHKEIVKASPLFSVVMPIYNVKKYVNESIESVLNQTFKDFEVILVDDGSTDGCRDICDYYVEKDKRSRVIHQENKGLLLARRAGIREACGKYLINVDSDDKCVATMLEELATIIEEYKPDLIIYNYSRVDDNGHVFEHKPVCQNNLEKLEKEWVLDRFVSTVDLNLMWIKCAKLDLVDADFDYTFYGKLNMAEDQLQSAAIFEKVNNIYYYSRSLYFYRDNCESITKKQTPKMVIDSLKAKQRVLSMLDNCNVTESTYKLFIKKYYRTLNSYLLKNKKYYSSIAEFDVFRNSIKEYEIKRLEDASVIDRWLYCLLNSNNRVLKEIIFQFYSIFEYAKQ